MHTLHFRGIDFKGGLPPGKILRAHVYAYTCKYKKVLEQLADRHRMFEKLTDIMGIPDVAFDEYEVNMNKWDDEVKDFILSAEKKCRMLKTIKLREAPSSRCGWEEGWSLLDFRYAQPRKNLGACAGTKDSKELAGDKD